IAEQAAQRRADDQSGGTVRAAAIVAVIIAAIDAGIARHPDRGVAAAIIVIGIIAAIARIRAVPIINIDATNLATIAPIMVATPVAAVPIPVPTPVAIVVTGIMP